MGKSNLIDNRRDQMPKTNPKGSRVYYPADDEVTNFVRKCKTPNKTKGRKCCEAGRVVILLSGRFRGKRVVVLKTLPSGLLLVTGPYKLNGVPLKRVNAAYVLPTSFKLNVSGADVSKVSDDYFARSSTKSDKKNEDAFFGSNPENKEDQAKLDAKRATQKAVDTNLLKEVTTHNHLAAYLGTRFSLRNNMKFHEI